MSVCLFCPVRYRCKRENHPSPATPAGNMMCVVLSMPSQKTTAVILGAALAAVAGMEVRHAPVP